jgi:hypothetical protein
MNLRAGSLVALVVGAAGSMVCMLRVGHRSGFILLALFTVWVLSPFVALVLADIVSRGWSVRTRATLYSLMWVFTLGSLAIYGTVAFGPPRPKPAFAFLVVPFVSWLFMTIAVPLSAWVSRSASISSNRQGGSSC